MVALDPAALLALSALITSFIALLLSHPTLIMVALGLSCVRSGVGIVTHDGLEGRPKCLNASEFVADGDDTLEGTVEFVDCRECVLKGLMSILEPCLVRPREGVTHNTDLAEECSALGLKVRTVARGGRGSEACVLIVGRHYVDLFISRSGVD